MGEAILARASGGGGGGAIKAEDLTPFALTSSSFKLVKDTSHSLSQTTTPLHIGIITASCACAFYRVRIYATHSTSSTYAQPYSWYEVRDEDGNILCTFTDNDGTTGYGSATSSYASLLFKEGANHIYFCTAQASSSTYGIGASRLEIQFYSSGFYALSETGETPTLTWDY